MADAVVDTNANPVIPPAGAAAAAIAPPAAAVVPPAAAAVVPSWTDGLSDDMKGFVANKGFQKPADALDSYRGLEKLLGGAPDKMIKLTDNWDKDAAIQSEIFGKLGRPLKAEDYNVQIPEGGSKEMAAWAKNAFHESNLTKGQAETFIGKYNDYMKGQNEAAIAANETAVKGEMSSLKKDWGNAYDQMFKQAQNAAREFGVKAEVIENLQKAMGYSETMKLFQKMGSKIGEDNFQTGKTGNSGAMTPDAAQQQITAYKADSKFMNRYISGDAEAKLIMNRLHEQLAAGKTVDF